MQTLLKISLIATIALSINSCGSKTPNQTANNRPVQVTEKSHQSESEKTIAKEEPTISEDSIKKKERELEWDGYEKERNRFDEVLRQASDEELFVVLKFALANQYVPNRDVDPYGYVFAGITRLHRSYLIYEKLSSRKDLLSKIYPDVQVLDEYVHWGRHSGQPYKNTRVSKAILYNAQKDKEKINAQMGSIFDTSSMAYKYFGTPFMRY